MKSWFFVVSRMADSFSNILLQIFFDLFGCGIFQQYCFVLVQQIQSGNCFYDESFDEKTGQLVTPRYVDQGDVTRQLFDNVDLAVVSLCRIYLS